MFETAKIDPVDLNTIAPDEREAEWFKTQYRGDEPQLTFRAVFMGSILGAFMSLSNLYVGLKTGWGLGVAITSCILAFAIYRTLITLFPRWFKSDLSILEVNCTQSTASSAGYSTGGTMVSAIAAYLIVTGHHIPWGVLGAWTFFLAALGVFMAIPMKRQMINVEQLRFPSGVAAAETLKSLYSTGSEGISKARWLGVSGVFGAVIAWLRDAGKPFSIPGQIPFPGTLMGAPLMKWTISFELSTIMIAAGAIMGWKIAWSLMLGAGVNYAILAPWAARHGAIDMTKLGYRAIVSWSTWTGTAIMVTSGLLHFGLQWRTVLRAINRSSRQLLNSIQAQLARTGSASFSGNSAARSETATKTHIFHGAASGDPIPVGSDLQKQMDQIEVPASWFMTGTLFSGLGCIYIMHHYFGTTATMGVIAVVMTFFLSLVACRATGESDITPIGAMGKITQLFFGAVAPSNLVTNLMTAGVTAGAAGSSADLLTDLKSGYLLGANPRKQFIAQFIGIFAGTLVVVPAFYLLVPTASSLGSAQWPAPAAQVWAAVARLLSNGVHSLHPTAQLGLVVGGAVGIILPLLEKLFPRQARFIPSATGVGLAMVIPFFNSFSMFVGAGVALVLEKKAPAIAEKFIIPVSSGLIAGESLMGVAVALLTASGMIS